MRVLSCPLLSFKTAFADWPAGQLRYDGDGKRFWRHVVASATGCPSPAYFDALYGHYLEPDSWTIAPGAEEAVAALRAGGIRVALVRSHPIVLELHM